MQLMALDILALHRAALLCDRSYLPSPVGCPAMSRLYENYPVCQFVSVEHHQAYVLEHANTVEIVVRGTDQAADWLKTNFALRRVAVPWAEGVMIHEGFAEATLSLGAALLKRSNANNNKGKFIRIYGHSLGGAIACLLAVRLRQCTTPPPIQAVITFGAPRIGDKAFHQMYKALGLGEVTTQVRGRSKGACDLVPRVPLSSLGAWHPPCTVAQLWAGRSPEIREGEAVWEKTRSLFPVTQAVVESVRGIPLHHIRSYCGALERLNHRSRKS